MTPQVDPKLVAEFFTYSCAEMEAMEQRAAEELYKAKRTRFKYARDLKLALRDRPVVERKPAPTSLPSRRQTDAQVAWGVGGGVFVTVCGMGCFFLILYLLQSALK